MSTIKLWHNIQSYFLQLEFLQCTIDAQKTFYTNHFSIMFYLFTMTFLFVCANSNVVMYDWWWVLTFARSFECPVHLFATHPLETDLHKLQWLLKSLKNTQNTGWWYTIKPVWFRCQDFKGDQPTSFYGYLSFWL